MVTGRAGVGRWLIVLPAVTLLLASSACGGSDEAPRSPGADRDPSVTTAVDPSASADPVDDDASAAPPDKPAPQGCDLVTDQEAAAVVGVKLGPKTASAQGCVWTAPPTGPTGQLEVYVGDGAKKTLDIARTLKHELEELPEVGDEAYLDGTSNDVFVRKGDIWVVIHLVRLNDPKENREPMVKLGRVVADRM
ncbi:hypothetical protein C1I95_08100 [Micromonospora craterilacus]|uniref:DUF3558 domain-containing protein n=1 Tax=Micromonospora craterilacus TaxID=1655439 RepID=A0A2W2F7Y1_9ACTN|nr:DUF3558 domain-containing protein [Micromonospora craterilacus]PZG21168.1 hypothetical protein C1I95_08100 [Micromonospora craterilacus]